MVWYSHLLKNLPESIVIHTIKGFGIVKKKKKKKKERKTEVDVYLELSSFFDDPMDVGKLISFSSF